MKKRDGQNFRMRLSLAFFLLAGLVIILATLIPIHAGADQSSWQVSEDKSAVPNPIPVNNKTLASGEAVYIRECLTCHGAAGRGDGPQAFTLDRTVPSLADRERMSEQTDGSLFYKITVGRKPMPSYRKTLTDEERWQVINYIHTFAPPMRDSKGSGKK